jgi:hypothetical protein
MTVRTGIIHSTNKKNASPQIIWNDQTSSSCLCLEEEVKVSFVLSEEDDLIQPDPNTELMLAFSGEFRILLPPTKITLARTSKISRTRYT